MRLGYWNLCWLLKEIHPYIDNDCREVTASCCTVDSKLSMSKERMESKSPGLLILSVQYFGVDLQKFYMSNYDRSYFLPSTKVQVMGGGSGITLIFWWFDCEIEVVFILWCVLSGLRLMSLMIASDRASKRLGKYKMRKTLNVILELLSVLNLPANDCFTKEDWVQLPVYYVAFIRSRRTWSWELYSWLANRIFVAVSIMLLCCDTNSVDSTIGIWQHISNLKSEVCQRKSSLCV